MAPPLVHVRDGEDNLETIARELGHRVAWNYLVDVERVNRDIAKDEYPAVFSGFFERAKELAPTSRIALLADGTAVLPAGPLVPRDEEEYNAIDAALAASCNSSMSRAT